MNDFRFQFSSIIRISILIFATPLLFSSCTIVGNFYLLNKSNEELDVTLNLKSSYNGIIDDYIIRIEDLSEKKIRYSTYRKMKKRISSIDTVRRQFNFELNPNEYAHIGIGPNTRIWNFNNLVIQKGNETIIIDGNDSTEFKLRRSGLVRYVGTKEIK